MIGVEKPFGKVTKRKRYFSENEIRWFLTAVRELASEPRQHGKKDQATRRWCKGLEILLRTGQRKMTILNAVDSELDYEAHTLTVPAERHKGGEEHKVWLVSQVEALLQSVDRPDTDQRRSNSQRVFQRLGSADTNLGRIRERMGLIAAKEGGKVAHWTIHDLRRTFMTVAADLVDENDGPLLVVGGIKKTAGHVMTGVDAHYFHGQAMPHKRRTMKVWNEYLDRLLGPGGLQKAA
jgi:integrase